MQSAVKKSVNNPITAKINKMVEIGFIITKKCNKCANLEPLGQASYESIAFATGIKYPTLMNILRRPKISYVTRMVLLKEGYIDYDDIKQYERWLQDNGIDKDLRGKVRPTKKKIACGPTKYSQPDSGDRETSAEIGLQFGEE